ncbi:hypothetical protein ACLF3G_23975 [Falsiroseomonas sp. HC035]|uniref:hypothetical protein n=1 Tax=Falsiroseomonas sp. HC035 TaxID=3390999 RepID=UPI003D321949
MTQADLVAVIEVAGILRETRRKPTAIVRVTLGPLTTTFEVVVRRFNQLVLRAPHGAGGVPAATVSGDLEADIIEAARPHLTR